jgi:hypothetical protein
MVFPYSYGKPRPPSGNAQSHEISIVASEVAEQAAAMLTNQLAMAARIIFSIAP